MKRSYELVVVPNACTDNTVQIVQKLAEKDPSIVVVENEKGGWGRSVLCGLAKSSGEVLCYTNSARTDPQNIVRLLDEFLKNGSCLAKVRREKRGVLVREWGSFLYNLEGRMLYGITAADINGTPKIMTGELYRKLELSCVDDLLDMEVLAKVTQLKIPIVEFPVEGFKRHGGKSSTNFKSAWNMYSGALRIRGLLREFAKAHS